MKKLPENPFKEADKLAEKLTLDIANKTDKALIDSLNDLIKAGILEVKYLVPHSEFNENYLTVKSGVQVVPKFDEYTKKLESENSELRRIKDDEHEHNKVLVKKVESLSNENTFLKNDGYIRVLTRQLEEEKKINYFQSNELHRHIVQSIDDNNKIRDLKNDLEITKGELTRVGWEYQDLKANYDKLKSENEKMRTRISKMGTAINIMAEQMTKKNKEIKQLKEELEASRQAS